MTELRGLGASARPEDGYDARTLAGDAATLLAALGEESAAAAAARLTVPTLAIGAQPAGRAAGAARAVPRR